MHRFVAALREAGPSSNIHSLSRPHTRVASHPIPPLGTPPIDSCRRGDPPRCIPSVPAKLRCPPLPLSADGTGGKMGHLVCNIPARVKDAPHTGTPQLRSPKILESQSD